MHWRYKSMLSLLKTVCFFSAWTFAQNRKISHVIFICVPNLQLNFWSSKISSRPLSVCDLHKFWSWGQVLSSSHCSVGLSLPYPYGSENHWKNRGLLVLYAPTWSWITSVRNNIVCCIWNEPSPLDASDRMKRVKYLPNC